MLPFITAWRPHCKVSTTSLSLHSDTCTTLENIIVYSFHFITSIKSNDDPSDNKTERNNKHLGFDAKICNGLHVNHLNTKNQY